jgi:hypothetical protein
LIRAANPKLLAGEAEQLLYQTAIDDEEFGIGYDKQTGWGKIDVGAAVARADSFPALFRDSTKIVTPVLVGAATTKHVLNCTFGNPLPNFTYANVEEYRMTGTVSFPFNHTPIAMVRERSIDGWPLTTKSNDGFGWAADTIVQFPWAEIDTIDFANRQCLFLLALITLELGVVIRRVLLVGGPATTHLAFPRRILICM